MLPFIAHFYEFFFLLMIGLLCMKIHSLVLLSQFSALLSKVCNRDFLLGVSRKYIHPPGFLVSEAVRR